MNIGDRVKERRMELGLSVEEVAKRINKNRATVYRYESKDIEKMPITILEPLARVLHTTPAYLMGWTEEKTIPLSVDVTKFDNIQPIERRRIPMLGEIACGQPIYASEDRESYVVSGTAINADFCLTCRGDSMTGARIYDGDIVFIRKQEMVNNGEIAAVIIGDDATLKRVYYYPEQRKLVLQAENPAYEPFVFVGDELDEITILGKAIAFQSDVR